MATILLSMLAGSCAAPADSTVYPTPSAPLSKISPPLQASSSPSPAPTLPGVTSTAPPAPVPGQKNLYSLEAVLDYEMHLLDVDEKIHFFNNSSATLYDLVLMVDPLYYPGTFQLESLTWGDGQPVNALNQEAGWLQFPLQKALAPGEMISLSIQYQLNLPSPQPSAAVRPIPFGYTERQTNLVDWYPFVPPYVSGKGWLANPAGFYGEHLAYDMADFTVKIRLANQRPDLTVAASSPAVQDGEWLSFTHQDARNFVWSVSPYYQMLTSQSGGIKVTSYAFQGHEMANQAVLDTTVAALDLYSRLFGPYPRQEMTVVEADFLDGMEYDGLYFLSKGFYNLYSGTAGEYLVAIAAHETAHQWWYALVGNDQALEPWLDEALSTYCERLYYENLLPEALDWWWDYRVNYYKPSGWVDDSIYNPHGVNEAYRAYREAVYLNGAVFMEELRQAMGDESFFSFLSEYAAQNRYKISTKPRFFSLAQLFSKTNLQPLLEKYFLTLE